MGQVTWKLQCFAIKSLQGKTGVFKSLTGQCQEICVGNGICGLRTREFSLPLMVWRLQRKGHRKSLCLAGRSSSLMFLMTVVQSGESLQKRNLVSWALGRNSAGYL